MAKLRLAFLILAIGACTMAIVSLFPNNPAKAEVAISPSTGGTCTHTILTANNPPGDLSYTISSSSIYCLSTSGNYSGATTSAIIINVTSGGIGAVLDFGGYNLNYTGTGGSTIGIEVTGNNNYVIRNGTITNFPIGIKVTGGGNVHLENMRIVAGTHGISIASGPTTVDHCFIQNMTETGIIVTTSSHVSITNNIIMDVTGSNAGNGGIDFDGAFTGHAIVDDNQFFSATHDAILGNANGTVIYRNNTALNSNTPYSLTGTSVEYYNLGALRSTNR